ncbi:MAG: hypothetical protein AABX84_01540 [Nanoarchaeota archaeon]
MTNLTDRVEKFRFKDSEGKIVEVYNMDLFEKCRYTIINPENGEREEFFGKINYIKGYSRVSGQNPNGRFEAFYIEEGEGKRHSISGRELGVQIHLINAGREKRILRGIVHKDMGHQYREHLIIDILDIVRIE